MTIRASLTAAGLFLFATAGQGADAVGPAHVLRSPDRRIEMRVRAADRIHYDVSFKGRPVVSDATLTLDVDHTKLGLAPKVRSARRRHVDATIDPPVRQKASRLRESYDELRLELAGACAVTFRAYDHGVAYRFETSLPAAEVTVFDEEATFVFPSGVPAWVPKEDGFVSHNERHYTPQPLSDLAEGALASLPVVVDVGGGVKVAVAESDVEDYAGLWLQGTGGDALRATFPRYPLEEELNKDRNLKVTRRAEHIARTRGTRTYPWRILAISEKDGELLTNPLVYLLASPSRIADTSWIRPGKVAWDWFNANNVYGVDFKSGVNTATYKYFIDFAAKHGLEYVILDEGWYVLGDLLKVAPDMDMDVLLAHAREKKVRLILWVVWKTLADQWDAAFDLFEKWGVAGIKVDFMQRDDQPLMDFHLRVCREAARRKLLVDFHGAQRPAMMTRTWPNLLTVEGVKGLENVKWSDTPHPEHNVTLPFTRMLLGPMDYTPGAMVNAAQKNFVKVFDQPMSLGTRAHQLAMYVVYESPLQMLADSPSHYLREPETMEFLSAVPTVWDETRVLDGVIGDYVAVARRQGGDWYVGAMTDWTARELILDLSFLPPGRYELDAYQDGVNAGRYGSDYRRVKRELDPSAPLKITLAEGGGWAARLHRR
jgi:alpha-glucosidase